jgi:hypothetical protein
MQAFVRPLLLVAAIAASQSLAAQNVVMTGQSHPELLAGANASIQTSAADAPAPAADAHAPVMPPDTLSEDQPMLDENAAISTPASADFGVVTRLPHNPSELAEGTILRTRLDELISSATTPQGSEFTAQIVRDVLQDGRVIIPTGSTLMGRVTKVVENRRIEGRCKLRLRPDEIILPDGSHLMLHAQVIDTDVFTDTRTDGEGTITSRDNAKKYWGIASATTGTGAIGGALVGGGIGAAVGAVIGAGVGATHYMMAHPTAELPRRSIVIFQLTEAMPIVPLHLGAAQ